MKKNYLRLMKIIGAMNSKEEVYLYLCNCINNYQASKTDYKNQVNFYPINNHNESLTVFFKKGKVTAVFQSFRTSTGDYRMLEYYPNNEYTNKLHFYK